MSSPYVQVELDALKKAPFLASALGIQLREAVGGLTLMWAHVYSERNDVVSAMYLRAFFGCDHAGEALEGFGFVTAHGSGWRVKGAGRYTRLAEVRAEAGRKGAAKTNGQKSANAAAKGRQNGGLPNDRSAPSEEGEGSAIAAANGRQKSAKVGFADSLPRQKAALEPIADSSVPTGQNIINARMNTCAGGDPEPALGAPAGSPYASPVGQEPSAARPPDHGESVDCFLARYPWPEDVADVIDVYAMQALTRQSTRCGRRVRDLRAELTVARHGALAVLEEPAPSEHPPPREGYSLAQGVMA